jgi:hypothetical protein
MIKYYVISENNSKESNEKEYKNYKYWRIEYTNKNGELHREDGPAQDFSGHKYYWYNDEHIDVKTDKEFKQYIKMRVFL